MWPRLIYNGVVETISGRQPAEPTGALLIVPEQRLVEISISEFKISYVSYLIN
jgi:hypothetical protein